jgi:hypothetical protein
MTSVISFQRFYKLCFQFQFTALHQGGAYTNAPYLYPVFNAWAVKVYSIAHSFLYHKVCFWSGLARRHCPPRHVTHWARRHSLLCH